MTVSRITANDRRFYGLAEALVTKNDDPEGLGRVKVVFPWFDNGRAESEWCRVANLYAGPGYGVCFAPEVDTEVLVAFVHGDMRIPVVLGGLFNGPQAPPTARKDEDRKLIRTQHGHELLLEDTQGAERVWLKTEQGHELTIDDVAGTLKAATQGGASVLIEKSGKVTIDTSAGAKITLEGSNATVEGAQVQINSSSISLGNAASQKLVLGDLFMTLFNAHVHTSSVPGSPTSPPVTPMTPTMLSSVAKAAM
jgi:uncharacterized protein involved in type VI secretion and phage assembly